MQINNRLCKRALLILSRITLSRPKLTLVCFGLLLLVSLVSATKLKSLYDLNDLVDTDFATYPGLHLLNSEFDDKNQLQLVFVRADWTEKELCHLRRIFTEFFMSRTDIKRLSSTFGLKQFTETSDQVKLNDIISLNCNAPTNQSKISDLQKIKTSPWNKTLNSITTYDIILQIGLHDNELGGRFGEFNPNVIIEIKQYFLKKLQSNQINAEVKLAGLVTFKYYLKKGYQLLQAMNGLSLLICIFIFWFFYRSQKAGYIFIASVSMTTLIIYGGMSAAGHSVDMLSNALPLMLTMSCLEDFVFLCHFRSHGYSFKKTLHKIILPSFLTSLTTAIGFGSLLFSDLSIIRRFGLWAAVGALTEWAIIFLLYPAAAKVFPKLHFAVSNRKIFFAHIDFGSTLTRLFKWTAYAIIPLSVWASTQLFINDSPDKIFPANHPLPQVSNWFKVNKGWTADFSILSDQKNKILQRKLDSVLAARSDVITFESPTQIEDYLVKNISPPFQNSLREQWAESSFARRLISENNLSRHIVYISDTSVEAVTKLSQFLIQNLCTTNDFKTCIVAGNTISYAEFGQRILSTLLESLVLSLFLVSLVIFIFRTLSLKSTFFLILSSIWGPLALILFFAVLKIPIFYVTSICASLLVGLAGDNAIQFMFFSKKINSSVDFLQEASLKIALGMALISVVLFLAPFTPLVNLGGIFILSFILLYIGDVLILKAFTKAADVKN